MRLLLGLSSRRAVLGSRGNESSGSGPSQIAVRVSLRKISSKTVWGITEIVACSRGEVVDGVSMVSDGSPIVSDSRLRVVLNQLLLGSILAIFRRRSVCAEEVGR